MLKVEEVGAFPRAARAIAARAKLETGADGVALALTDGPTVRFRYGVGVLEGEGGADVFGSVQAVIGRLGVRSVISVPLTAGHRPCGEMTAVRCGPVAFDEADSDALNQLASLVGDAIESAWELRDACGWLALENAPIGMAVTALDGTFLEVNQSFAACLGWSRPQLVGRTFQSICHPEDVGLNQRLLDRAVAEGSTAFRMEERYRRADGSVVWADLSVTIVRDADGEARRLISQVVDVTDRVEAELLLAHRASHDRLTGLPNRRRFTAAVAAAATTAQRYGTSIAVLFLNLDRFKVVNESIGHEGGDELLCEVARRLRLAAGSAETVGRFGADAFAILCEGVKGPEGARWIAARMLTSLHQPVLVGGREVSAAASVGIALGGAVRATSAAVLLREADAACSLAKARGGGTVAMFDEALRDRAEERLDVEAALHHALVREELRLAYQPQIDLGTGQLAGFEALLRWEHPTLGLLTPETFINVAEESGLVVEMGHWALAAAARQMGTWRRQWPELASVTMAVNVAARQLADPRLPGLVADAQDLAGPGAPLSLEVTETEMLASAADAQAVLARLRGGGVHIALDDLGTGYATLAYVAGLEADVLKVDRSFTAGLGEHRAHSAVVAAIVSLGRSLGHRVVAEGVETAEQARLLRELGCDLAQGYLCGRPAAAETLVPILEQAATGAPIFTL